MQMIRFWFKTVFELPCLDNVRFLIRLDLDSRLTELWVNVFDRMEEKKAVYWANMVIYDSEWTTPGQGSGLGSRGREGEEGGVLGRYLHSNRGQGKPVRWGLSMTASGPRQVRGLGVL